MSFLPEKQAGEGCGPYKRVLYVEDGGGMDRKTLTFFIFKGIIVFSLTT
jgi:hypothetical protein